MAYLCNIACVKAILGHELVDRNSSHFQKGFAHSCDGLAELYFDHIKLLRVNVVLDVIVFVSSNAQARDEQIADDTLNSLDIF